MLMNELSAVGPMRPCSLGRCENLIFEPIFMGHILKVAYEYVWKNEKKFKLIDPREVPAHFKTIL